MVTSKRSPMSTCQRVDMGGCQLPSIGRNVRQRTEISFIAKTRGAEIVNSNDHKRLPAWRPTGFSV